MSLDEIRNLIKQERTLEERHSDEERKAAEIINRAKEKAAQIIAEVSDDSYYKDILKQKSDEIEEKKRLIDKEADERIELLGRIAAQNRERTVLFIVELVLGE
jgi:vacuolar-type H+-ATPase subunit H